MWWSLKPSIIVTSSTHREATKCCENMHFRRPDPGYPQYKVPELEFPGFHPTVTPLLFEIRRQPWYQKVLAG